MQKPYLHVRACKHRYRADIGICVNSGLPITMVPRLHQCNVYIRRKLRVWRVKNVLSYSVEKAYLPARACKLPRFMRFSMMRTKFAEILLYISPWYHVCTNAIFISKGSYGYGEPKNLFPYSVQKSYLTLE